jgi:hypothetical protein
MQIVNVRDFGGVAAARAAGVVYCGRPSALGNPFHLQPGEPRGATIRQYRRWLWNKIQTGDQQVLGALSVLRPDSTLGCWCAPEPCHCEVIARAWQWLEAAQACPST